MKTLSQLKDAEQVIAELFEQNPELEKSKLKYAWKRFSEKNLVPIYKEIQEKIADERLKNALTDKATKEVLFTEGPKPTYKFDKAGTQAVIEFTRDVEKEYDAKEFEVKPFIITDVLDEYQKEVLTGLII